MGENTITLDAQRQQKAKQYARISRRLLLVDLAITGVYTLAWLLFGWSAGLRDVLLTFTGSSWLLVAGFAVVFGGVYSLINLPLAYYEGFVLPHRFGQSTQTVRGWVVDQIKGAVVTGLLGVLLLEIIYAVLRVVPQTWWLWAGFALLFFNVVLTSLAPILLFPLFNKFVPLGDERKELSERLIALAERAGTRVEGVYMFDMSRRTRSANAALTGLGRTRRIILGDTLLNEFTVEEIETIMAHELGHQVNRDIPLGIAVGSVLTLGGLYLASLGLRWGVTYFGFESLADVAAIPIFVLVMGLYALITTPLSNTYSRWRERMADRYALRLTGNGKAYAAALTRLANQNLAEVDPELWVEFLLHSHPALHRRIAMAQEGG
ncbi:MAG: M48 family metallopeptidase [Anaerolineae bacterium]|nr:M48 family metallopeptidase [Anaerolineae bacterium]